LKRTRLRRSSISTDVCCRDSVFGRPVGCEDVNDADPTSWVVGDQAIVGSGTSSEMGREPPQ
jgi:hypothetical protein